MEDDKRILIEMAKMYYEEDRNQTEVAKHFNVSRSLVSKYLTKAREMGLVEITINSGNINPYRDIEDKLIDDFGFREVICIEFTDNVELLNHRLGIAAARYLGRILVEDSTISVAPGRAIQSLARNFSSRIAMPNVQVYPLTGGLGDRHSDIQANVVGELLSQKIGGCYHHLHAPVLVDSAEAKSVFMNQSFISNIFEKAKEAKIALVGIGGVPTYNEMKSAYLHKIDSHVEIDDLSIDGDICYNFIDKNGESVDCDWNNRVMALSLQEIKEIETVVAISGGVEKLSGIKAAIESDVIDVLITDNKTGLELLKISERTK